MAKAERRVWSKEGTIRAVGSSDSWCLIPFGEEYRDYHAYVERRRNHYVVTNYNNVLVRTKTLKAAKTAYMLLFGDA